MSAENFRFSRRFSINLHRNLFLPLSEMSMDKDWAHTDRGDPYPLLQKTGEVREEILEGRYVLTTDNGGSITRLLGSFFPYATYEIGIDCIENGMAGFSFTNDLGFSLSILADREHIALKCGETDLTFSCRQGSRYSFSFRHGGVSLYERTGDAHDSVLADVPLKELESLTTSAAFRRTRVGVTVALLPDGKAILSGIGSKINCGISQADLKPVKYENGEIMIHSGRIFITASARLEVGCHQIVLSWCPSTDDFKMEGAIFYDCGDGKWSDDVALSLVFDRQRQKWIYWMCAFSHGHVLGRGETDYDPLYGIQLLKVTPLEPASDPNDYTLFAGVRGDEDPDLIYYNGAWHLSVCRLESDGTYHYQHFTSSHPLDGFTWCDRTPTGEKTGGMFCRLDGKLFFICGSDFQKRAVYDVYPWNDFSSCQPLHPDFDDGGFRGWGSVMEIPCGSEKNAVWITFDRHKGSEWNWSYGNIYVFDMLLD